MPFDPYHKWLGIPPSEQPPDRYRLLGVGRFESDPEVIDAAANRQMAYVQGFAQGERGAASQRLLNELSAARLCLLDPASRAAYDASLQESQVVPDAPRPRPAAPRPAPRAARPRPPQSPPPDDPPPPPPLGPRLRTTPRPAPRRAPWTSLATAAAVLVLAAAIGVEQSYRKRAAPSPPEPASSSGLAELATAPTPEATKPTEEAAPSHLPAGAVAFGDAYYKVYWEELSWPEAEERCRKLGGRLASVEPGTQHGFLAELKGDGSVVWVGGFRYRTGEWRWTNGKAIEQPDRIGGDQPGFHHVAFSVGDSLNCRPRSGRVPGYAVEAVQGYICEWGRTADPGQPFDLARCEPVGEACPLLGHKDYVNCVAFSPDGRFAASGSNDRTVKLWDLRTGREAWTHADFRDFLRAVAFSPDGRTVLACDLGSVSLLDARTGRAEATFDIKGWDRACFSKDGRFLFAKHPDGSATVYDVAARQPIRSLDRKYIAHSGAFTPDGRKVLFGVKGLSMLDVQSGREDPTPIRQSCYIEALDVSPDGGLLATASGRVWSGDHDLPGDRSVRLWDLRDGREVALLGQHDGWPWTVAFSPDGRRVLSGGSGRVDDWFGHKPGADNSLRLWDVDSARQVHRFEGHGAAVLSVVFSADGHHALSGSSDATVRLWRLPD